MGLHLRIARPVAHLQQARARYVAGFDFEVLGAFEDHAGFDGVMLGIPGADYHLELTYCRLHPVQPAPTREDMLVFYLPDRSAWQHRCDCLVAAGFIAVPAFNPYWNAHGRCFQDSDGYLSVLQHGQWPQGQDAPRS